MTMEERANGLTISKNDPHTGADLIPWEDVAVACDYFSLNRKNADQGLDKGAAITGTPGH